MIVRRLEQSEHGKTRSLWEEVFTEDTSAFLDYYYYIKTKDNQIYVVEEDGQICSMLQLNPYLLKIEESERPSAYIIAVATKEEYRGRGFMGNLLRQALNDMYTAKVPFTFLMPAAEAIYTPYDFRFIYSQRIGIQDISSNVASGKGTTVRNCTFTDAAVWNAEEMAAFFNSYRIYPLMNQLLIEDIKHLKKRTVCRDVLYLICLKMSFGLGVFLTPYS